MKACKLLLKKENLNSTNPVISRYMENYSELMKIGSLLETKEQLFYEKDLLMGILWEGDAQLHTNWPGMEKSPFGKVIVHGNSVTSKVVGQLLRMYFAEADKVIINDLGVSYVGAVNIGDRIKGSFTIVGFDKTSKDSRMLLDFEVKKNKDTVVSKGKMTIQVVERR